MSNLPTKDIITAFASLLNQYDYYDRKSDFLQIKIKYLAEKLNIECPTKFDIFDESVETFYRKVFSFLTKEQYEVLYLTTQCKALREFKDKLIYSRDKESTAKEKEEDKKAEVFGKKILNRIISFKTKDIILKDIFTEYINQSKVYKPWSWFYIDSLLHSIYEKYNFNFTLSQIDKFISMYRDLTISYYESRFKKSKIIIDILNSYSKTIDTDINDKNSTHYKIAFNTMMYNQRKNILFDVVAEKKIAGKAEYHARPLEFDIVKKDFAKDKELANKFELPKFLYYIIKAECKLTSLDENQTLNMNSESYDEYFHDTPKFAFQAIKIDDIAELQEESCRKIRLEYAILISLYHVLAAFINNYFNTECISFKENGDKTMQSSFMIPMGKFYYKFYIDNLFVLRIENGK